MKNDKLKKFNEFNPDELIDEMSLFVDEEIQVKMSEFEHIDEGILANIKKSGFFKSIKRAGLKVGSRITDYIKNDKKLQAALSGAVKAGGEGVMDDIGTMFTQMDAKLQAAELRAQEAEAKVEDQD